MGDEYTNVKWYPHVICSQVFQDTVDFFGDKGKALIWWLTPNHIIGIQVPYDVYFRRNEWLLKWIKQGIKNNRLEVKGDSEDD